MIGIKPISRKKFPVKKKKPAKKRYVSSGGGKKKPEKKAEKENRGAPSRIKGSKKITYRKGPQYR